MANIKLTNAAKVATTVHLTVKPISKDAVTPFPMSAQPAELRVPPHESRFVQLCFHPRQIQPFAGLFEAVAEYGEGNAATHKFSCELQVPPVSPDVYFQALHACHRLVHVSDERHIASTRSHKQCRAEVYCQL